MEKQDQEQNKDYENAANEKTESGGSSFRKPCAVLRSLTIAFVVVVLAAVGFLVYQNIGLFSFSPEKGVLRQERTPKQLEYPELFLEDLAVSKEGGRRVEWGDAIVVHYVGMLEDGSVFESTIEKNRAFLFTVGSGNVIKAWSLGVEGMRVGDKRKIISPPHLAYGKSGVRNLIDPEATVVFEIELLEIRE